MKYINNAGLELEIISREGRDCVVKFTKSGSVRRAKLINIQQGKVKDNYAPSRYGLGYSGDFEKVPYWKQARQLWSNMMKRCYCEKDPKGYHGKTIVDARWHCFANFLIDLKSLKGFNDWVNGKNMQLDKDRFGNGSTYSRETCMFLSEFENKSQVPNYREGKQFCKKTRQWLATIV